MKNIKDLERKVIKATYVLICLLASAVFVKNKEEQTFLHRHLQLLRYNLIDS